jgi:hypothetical protein
MEGVREDVLALFAEAQCMGGQLDRWIASHHWSATRSVAHKRAYDQDYAWRHRARRAEIARDWRDRLRGYVAICVWPGCVARARKRYCEKHGALDYRRRQVAEHGPGAVAAKEAAKQRRYRLARDAEEQRRRNREYARRHRAGLTKAMRSCSVCGSLDHDRRLCRRAG